MHRRDDERETHGGWGTHDDATRAMPRHAGADGTTRFPAPSDTAGDATQRIDTRRAWADEAPAAPMPPSYAPAGPGPADRGVDEYGRPVDEYGGPVDEYGRPVHPDEPSVTNRAEEPPPRRTGWIVAVVLLALAVLVLLGLLLTRGDAGGGSTAPEATPTAPESTSQARDGTEPGESGSGREGGEDRVPTGTSTPTGDPEEQDGLVPDGLRDVVPEDLPSQLPTDLPGDLPSELPSIPAPDVPDDLGAQVQQGVEDFLAGLRGLVSGDGAPQETPAG